jgi:hypothetical protein
VATDKGITGGLQQPDPRALTGADAGERGIFTSAAEVSKKEAVSTAMDQAGLVSERGVQAMKEAADNVFGEDHLDPNLNYKEVLDRPENVDRKSFTELMLSGSTPTAQRFRAKFVAAEDEDDLIELVDTTKNILDEQEIAGSGGAALELLGGFLGVSRDLLLTLPIGGLGVAGVRATGVVAKGLLELGVYSTTEAAVAGAERLIRAQRDLTIDGTSDALNAAVMAGGLTFLLGGSIAAVARRNDIMKKLAVRAKEAQVTQRAAAAADGTPAVPRGLSSQASPDPAAPIISATEGSLVARFVPTWFRTLKGQATDRLADGTKRFLDDGVKGDLESARLLQEIVGADVHLQGLDGDAIAKLRSLEDAVMTGQQEGASLGTIISQNYQDWAVQTFTAKGSKPPMTEAEFNRLVSRVIWGRHTGIDDRNVILGRFATELAEDDVGHLGAALARSADTVKEATSALGKRMEAVGMLEEGQAIENYMNITMRRGSGATEDEYYEYILDMISRPHEKNVNELHPGVLEAGETWADLLKRDPDRAREIADDLDARRLQARGDKTYERRLNTDKEVADFEASTSAAFKKSWEARLAKTEVSLAGKNKGRKLTAEGIKKARAEIENMRVRLEELEGAGSAKIRDLIKRYGNQSQKAGGKKLFDKQRRSVKAETKASRAEPMSEVARSIARKMVNGENPGGFVPDELTANIGFTKERVIPHDPFDPRFEHLFEMDAQVNMRVHSTQLHPRLWLHEKYGKLAKEGEDVAKVPLRLMDEAGEGGDKITKAAVTRDKDMASAAIKASLNLDRIPQSEAWRKLDFWSQQIAKFNIASMLKLLGVTQITDFALVAARGRNFKTGVTGVFRSKQSFKLAQEARRAGQVDLVRILEGIEIMGLRNPMRDLLDGKASRRMLDMYGVDPEVTLARSELEHSVERGLDKVSAIAGWLSFGTPMNMVLRRAMGADTAKLLVDDFTNFARLSDDIKRKWLQHGIDEDVANELGAYLKTKNGTIEIEGVKFPNFRGLREIDPQLADHAVMASNRLAGEVFPTVTPFTKPLLSRTPMGRLALQFSSFSYAVGVTVLPEIKREFRNRPLGYRNAAFVLGGITAAMATIYLKSAIYGGDNLEKFHEQLTTPEGMVQMMQRAILIMPMMPGMSSQFSEIALQSASPMANAFLGRDLLLTSPARFGFRGGEQAAIRLGGPTMTQAIRALGATGDLMDSVKAMAEDNSPKAQEEALKAVKTLHMMTPILDSLPWRVFESAVEKAYGE